MYELQISAGTLERGIHECIQMRGRLVSGFVRRAYLDMYGQALIIQATGRPADLYILESKLLSGSPYWEGWRLEGAPEPVPTARSHNFVIAQSFGSAARGPNSDPAHDNASERSRGSRSSEDSDS